MSNRTEKRFATGIPATMLVRTEEATKSVKVLIHVSMFVHVKEPHKWPCKADQVIFLRGQQMYNLNVT